MDFAIGTPLYWIAGFGIMFGTSNLYFGGFDFSGFPTASRSLPL